MMVSLKNRLRAVVVVGLTILSFSASLVDSFVSNKPTTTFRRGGGLSCSSANVERRRNVCIPLLDLSDSEIVDKVVIPLPSAHLPSELTTLNLYGMQLQRPVHKMLIEEAIEAAGEGKERVFGYIVKKTNDDDTLVGAVGCTAEILINAVPSDADFTKSDVGKDVPITVLCRGSYRFVVKEVVKTFPYPVAVVDELVDEEPAVVVEVVKDDETDDEDQDEEEVKEADEDDDPYADLDASELVQRTMAGLTAFIVQKLDTEKPDLSPLEKSILEDTGLPMNQQQSQAEEMAAILDVFTDALIDIAPMPVDRYFAIAMMAAEMISVDNEVRRKLIPMTDGLARLRIVLPEVEAAVSMNQARKMANTITDEIDEDKKDLQVGEPQLPPWTKSLKDGTRIEYFWSEHDGWCSGVVVGEPVKVVDELIVTVLFDDDGSTHCLPLSPDEKVRWRPPQ